MALAWYADRRSVRSLFIPGGLMPTEIIEAAVGLMGLGAVWGVYRLITLAARSRERLRF